MFKVTVRDTYLRETVETAEVATKEEANNWAKEFRQQYPKDCGYSVNVQSA